METKTCLERIKEIVKTADMGQDSMEKLVALAYWYGREYATRKVSDLYAEHIAQQHRRAEECRYAKMAERIVGKEAYLYTSDYSMYMTDLFGSDPCTC